MNFLNFLDSRIFPGLFFNKIAGLRSETLTKRRFRFWCFPANFAKFLRTPILQNTSKPLLLISVLKLQKQPSRGVLIKGVLKICSKITGEHPCRSGISINLQSNFIEIARRHGQSPINLVHIFRTPFFKNTFGRLLLKLS